MRNFVLFVSAAVLAVSTLFYACTSQEKLNVFDTKVYIHSIEGQGRINPLHMGRMHNQLILKMYSEGVLSKESNTTYTSSLL